MHGFAEHLSPLTKFAIAIGAAVLLPKAMERVRLPAVLGFILAGFILGPAMLNVVAPDGPTMVLLAELGKLMFMFFVGFEINLAEFNRSRNRSLTFGSLTFLLPFAGGVMLGKLTGNGWNSAFLIGSLIASHTLLAFPVVQRLGLTQHPAVTMVVGGTIFTDIASMLVLAVTVSVHQTGFSWGFLGKELLELAIFVPLILFGAGNLARKAIIRWGHSPEGRVMVLMVVIAFCAEGAQWIHLEGIVGAFLAGIAVKRAVRGKFAVEELEVTSRALFIPAFFLATGFLVNFTLLGKVMLSRPGVVLGLIAVLVVGKYVAAWICGWIFPTSRTEVGLVWSLSLPQMAATLASAVVAYKTLNASGQRLLDDTYVNAVLVLVVVTCVAGPIFSEKQAKRLKLLETENQCPNGSLPPSISAT